MRAVEAPKFRALSVLRGPSHQREVDRFVFPFDYRDRLP